MLLVQIQPGRPVLQPLSFVCGRNNVFAYVRVADYFVKINRSTPIFQGFVDVAAVDRCRSVNFGFNFRIRIGKQDDSAAAQQILVKSIGKQRRNIGGAYQKQGLDIVRNFDHS